LIRFIREVFTIAISKRAGTLVTVLLSAALCATVLLTTGRTLGAHNEVLRTIDSLGTRLITIKISDQAGVGPEVVQRIGHLDQVQEVAALSSPLDAHNALLNDSRSVAARFYWSSASDPAAMAQTDGPTLNSLQISGSIGSVRLQNGVQYPIERTSIVPETLKAFEPLVLLPTQRTAGLHVTVVVVVARTPDAVDALARAVPPLIGISDPSQIQMNTSAELASLRANVDEQLGGFGRSLVLVLFASAALLTLCTLLALVAMQRKDFGRRRALGATRSYILALICTQYLMTGAVGALLGTVTTLVALAATSTPLPPPEFCVAVAILAASSSVVGAAIPGIYASRRDPVHELRVP
jgi:putative ABC transport system permease protein